MSRGGVGMIYKCRSRILEQNQGIYWHQRTWRHRLQLGCPWMGGRESSMIYWFHTSFRSPEERGRIWSPFGS